MANYNIPVLDAGNLIPTVKLGTGTANNTSFLRGDQTYAVPAATMPDIVVQIQGVCSRKCLEYRVVQVNPSGSDKISSI